MKISRFFTILNIFYRDQVNWPSSGSENIILKIVGKNISEKLQNDNAQSPNLDITNFFFKYILLQYVFVNHIYNQN